MIVCHPESLNDLKAICAKHDPEAKRMGIPCAEAMFTGTQIQTSTHCPRWSRKWEFPQERHIEYEKSDEIWCRYFGIGHEVEIIGSPWFAVIQPQFLLRKMGLS